MDYIIITDNKNSRRKMEVVATFKIEGYSNSYVVYKELDSSSYYLGKYRKNSSKLTTDISDSEYKLCKAIFEGLMEKDDKEVPTLNVEKKHHNIKIGAIRRAATRISAAILGLTMTISLSSGFIPKAHAETLPSEGIYDSDEDSTVIEIPERIRGMVSISAGKNYGDEITIRDLKAITSLMLSLDNSVDSLEFLKYCTNLETLNIYNVGLSSLDILRTIPILNNSIKTISINSLAKPLELDKDLLEYIMQSTRASSLSLSSVIIAPGCEESLSKLDTLSLISNEYSYDIDFNRIIGLKELDLSEEWPYSIAMYLNRDEYNHLIGNGTNIVFKDEESKATYLRTLDDLDEIVRSIHIDENATEMDVVNAVLAYVCDHLTYSESVRNKEEDGERYYENGLLDAVFNNPDQICGNYAALVEAIMDRIRPPEDSTFLTSENHAWNLIMINGNPYYVDATWLDNEYITIEEIEEFGFMQSISYTPIKFGEAVAGGYDTSEFHWNKMEIDSPKFKIYEQQDAHNPSFELSYMSPREYYDPIVTEDPVTPVEIEKPIETEKPAESEKLVDREEQKEKEYKVKFGKKEIIISGSVLVALLTGAGVLVAVKKKKEEDERRRRRMQSGYQNSYGSTSSYRQSPRHPSSYGGNSYIPTSYGQNDSRNGSSGRRRR